MLQNTRRRLFFYKKQTVPFISIILNRSNIYNICYNVASLVSEYLLNAKNCKSKQNLHLAAEFCLSPNKQL